MRLEENVSLDRLTTFGTGGPARALAWPENAKELEEALVWAAERTLRTLAIGLGSNVLVSDEGVNALVLRLIGELARVEFRSELMIAGAGAADAACAHYACEAGLSGFEFASAIPGTVGGGVAMNAGAWGGQFSDVLERALVVDGSGSHWLEPGQLGLRYRGSTLEPGQLVAVAEFRLTAGTPEQVAETQKRMKTTRGDSQPPGNRTFGSVFKNPEHELGAGEMIDACGLRGHSSGGARISPEHANFIENMGTASSADALALMNEARRLVFERFGVTLEPEVKLIGDIVLAPVGLSQA